MAHQQISYQFPSEYADTYKISYHCESGMYRHADIHTHNCDEILFVRSGNVENYLGNAWTKHSGACIIYNKAGDAHLTLNSPGCVYERYNIRYSRSVLEKQHIRLPIMDSFLCTIGEEDTVLFTYAELLLGEYTMLNRSPVAEQSKTYLLASLLCRAFKIAQEYSMKTLPAYCSYIRGVLQYISLHYSEELTLDILAHMFFVGKTKLCRDFRTYTGTSIAAYITDIRVDHAKEFLMMGHSVRETAELVGYEYESNFIYLFRKSTGVTPLQFKRNANTPIPEKRAGSSQMIT